MSIQITKTSKQAKFDSENNATRCPECNSSALFGSYHIENTGFLGLGSGTKVTSYNCICGCEFTKRG